ncbi:hypothetical protein, partial [Cohnella sp.]|uniref:hypothetical protein n=1 Tax=Cohnella sp. TaxID=1883426 RepID=UPI003563A778
MKINKLSFTIILILIFIVVLWFVQNQPKQKSGGDNLSQDKFEQGIQPEADNLKFVEELRKNHPDRFAGAYLDDHGVLNINLVTGVAPTELNIDISKIKVHYVEYSY